MNTRRNDKKSNPYASRLSRPGVVLVLIVLGALSLASCGADADTGDPEAALNAYAAGINAHSVDEAMAAFADEARMIDHPLNPGELNGKAEVRRGVTASVNLARVDPDAYSIFDVVVDGDTVSWSYVWNNGTQDFCAVGNEIDVNDDGLIKELRWGVEPDVCNE